MVLVDWGLIGCGGEIYDGLPAGQDAFAYVPHKLHSGVLGVVWGH